MWYGADLCVGFVVGSSTTGVVSKDELPAVLRTVPYPTPKSTVDRNFEFQHNNGRWQISDHVWSDGPEARVLAKPERGAIEVWELKNSAGGWSHPIHIHLVSIVSFCNIFRTEPLTCPGLGGLPNHKPRRGSRSSLAIRSGCLEGCDLAQHGRNRKSHRQICSLGWYVYHKESAPCIPGSSSYLYRVIHVPLSQLDPRGTC